MTDLLRSHPRIALGRERYNSLFKREGKLVPELFEKERFCRILQKGDTHHAQLGPYYEMLEDRFDDCALIGDKIPSLYRNYAHLDHGFPDHKIIFMVRNVFDVANSFEGRREHSLATPSAPWPMTKGYQQAVADWNASLAETLKIKGRPNVMVVEFERLYVDDSLLGALFDFLSLDCVAQVDAFWQKAALQRVRIEAQRSARLRSPHKHYIRKHAGFADYQALVSD